jgi:hypothetical protein
LVPPVQSVAEMTGMAHSLVTSWVERPSSGNLTGRHPPSMADLSFS